MPNLPDRPDFQTAVEWLRTAQRVVAFTGAGISASCGVPTFRDRDGFWQRFPPEEFANWQGLLQTALIEPKRLVEFLLAVIEPIAMAEPNRAHQALADLQKTASVTVVTQNIDRLHQLAGSETVLEIHGTLFEVVSVPQGNLLRSLSRDDLLELVQTIRQTQHEFWTGSRLLAAVQPVLGLDKDGMHRPNLVLFGDQLKEPDWSQALDAAQHCDLFLSIGTSHSVTPAATLPELAQLHGARVIGIDPLSPVGDFTIRGSAEEILPKLVSEMTSKTHD